MGVDSGLPAVEAFELQQVGTQCGCCWGGVSGGLDVACEDTADPAPSYGSTVIDDEAKSDPWGE